MTPIVDEAREREAFEQAMRSRGYTDESYFRHSIVPGLYAHALISAAWAAWLAAKQDALPRWIAVSERLPGPDAGECLWYQPPVIRGTHRTDCNLAARVLVGRGKPVSSRETTHWKELGPLPAPPGETP